MNGLEIFRVVSLVLLLGGARLSSANLPSLAILFSLAGLAVLFPGLKRLRGAAPRHLFLAAALLFFWGSNSIARWGGDLGAVIIRAADALKLGDSGVVAAGAEVALMALCLLAGMACLAFWTGRWGRTLRFQPGPSAIRGAVRLERGTRWFFKALMWGFLLAFGAGACVMLASHGYYRGEGDFLAPVLRLREGRALYAEPSLEWIPLMYTPLYFYCVAGVSILTGSNILAARLASIAGTVAACLLLYIWLRKEGLKPSLALAGPGLFLATFGFVNYSYACARVDIFSFSWVLGAAFLARHGKGAWSGAAAAVLVCLGALSKQTALAMALPILAYCLARKRPMGLAFGTCLLALGLGVVAAGQGSSHGWFLFYSLGFSTHPFSPDPVWRALVFQLLPHFWESLILAGAFFFLMRKAGDKEGLAYFACLGMGFVGAAFLSTAHSGSDLNSLIPCVLFLALCVPLAMDGFLRLSPRLPRAQGLLLLSLVWTMGLAQEVRLLYRPVLSDIAVEAEDGGEVGAELRDLPGKVFFPERCYWLFSAGKPLCPSLLPVIELLSFRSGSQAVKEKFIFSAGKALASGEYSAVILSPMQTLGSAEMDMNIARNFVLAPPDLRWAAIQEHWNLYLWRGREASQEL